VLLGKERVSEASSEGELVSEVEGERAGVRSSGHGLGLDVGEYKLGVLVREVLGGGEDRSEEREEVLPAC
jgi:hypothetical protein